MAQPWEEGARWDRVGVDSSCGFFASQVGPEKGETAASTNPRSGELSCICGVYRTCWNTKMNDLAHLFYRYLREVYFAGHANDRSDS